MELTHVNQKGDAHMVDVADKVNTQRVAEAVATVTMRPETLKLIAEGGIPKGDVFSTARIAAIMAAKKTYELIPMCHPVPIDQVTIEFSAMLPDTMHISATVKCIYKTGVEMEALTAASVAALTVYDMCKAVDKTMQIKTALKRKSGGRSGDFYAKEEL